MQVSLPELNNLLHLDSFHVYDGPVAELNAYHFSHVLRDPGCFYFFNIACMTNPDSEGDQRLIRRDLCWLTGKFR